MLKKHLWDIEHSYYCNKSREINQKFKSWKEFIDTGDIDFDMNLLFRWDWSVDDRGLNILHLFWILQRKSSFITDSIIVSKSDEGEIIEWLNERFDHLFKLWEPIA